MSKIIKNNTASPVTINDVGITVPASGQYLIDAGEYPIFSRSSDIVTLVGASTLTINNGDIDLSISEGIRLIQGNFPESVGIIGPTKTKITNLTLVSASTEYSHTFEDGVKHITIKSRQPALWKLAWGVGESNTKYMTLQGTAYEQQAVYFTGKTIYVQSTLAGCILEIEELYD